LRNLVNTQNHDANGFGNCPNNLKNGWVLIMEKKRWLRNFNDLDFILYLYELIIGMSGYYL
jgi:hypothetical protein